MNKRLRNLIKGKNKITFKKQKNHKVILVNAKIDGGDNSLTKL